MRILKGLFGDKDTAADAPDPDTYEGFSIFPEPIREGGQWRIAARIEKEIGGEVRSYRLIRADTLDSQDGAIAAAIGKAKQVIDEQGDGLFD